MSNPLDTVLEAREGVADAQSRLRDAIVLASASGARAVEIAEASGLTRQRVYQILAAETEWEASASARVAEVDAKYTHLLDELAAGEGKAGDYRRVTAFQNGMNRKLAKRGLAYAPVSVELRRLAEAKLLKVLQDRRDEPFVDGFVRELDEAEALRKRLSARAEARAFGGAL